MEDKELDSLLEQWAQEEIDVPFGVHEKTMLRIRQEVNRKKVKKWSSAVAVAAVCCLCVPLAMTQMGMQEEKDAQGAAPMLAAYDVAETTVEEPKAEEKAAFFTVNESVSETSENSVDMMIASGTPLEGAQNQSAKIVIVEEETAEKNVFTEMTDNEFVPNETEWIERITELESATQSLVAQLEEKIEAESQAEKDRLWSLVQEYERSLDEEYAALNLRLMAVKKQLEEIK